MTSIINQIQASIISEAGLT
jgi:hypothetical protein